jgi:hypothetical protein
MQNKKYSRTTRVAMSFPESNVEVNMPTEKKMAAKDKDTRTSVKNL